MNVFNKSAKGIVRKTAVLRRTRLAALLLLVALTALTTACSAGSQGGNEAAEGKLSVVTSFYPLYYLASEIGGDHVAVTNLVPAGVEPHDWTPKSKDLSLTSKASLFLYNGAGFEGWVGDFLQGLDKDSRVVSIEASQGVDLIKAGETNAGTLGAAEPAAETGEQPAQVDPHTWVSPKSAIVMAENVKNSLVKADAVNKADYEANYEALRKKLSEMDAAFRSDIAALPKRDIVVSHEAFGYLSRDYGLNQVAIMGLAPDAEPKAQDLKEIVDFVQNKEIRYIFFEELVSPELAQTLASEADAETLVLNPLEGLTPEQEDQGENYVTLMERNFQNLKKALQ